MKVNIFHNKDPGCNPVEGRSEAQPIISGLAIERGFACVDLSLHGPARNLAPPAGFELVDEPECARGGPPTMPGGRKPVLTVTVFTDYI